MITAENWRKDLDRLAAIDEKAADLMRLYIEQNGLQDSEALIQYAYALATKYGEASATLACEMYDYMAGLMQAGVPGAIPAETATLEEVAKGVNWGKYHSPSQIPSIVSRQVRQAGADSMLQNAARDGAQWAWIPAPGETCAFCIMLASNGWQYASEAIKKGNHADHIHTHCDCTFAIAFKPKDREQYDYVYDPKKYEDMYNSAEGETWEERVNSIRRQIYQDRKDAINAQKRDAYAVRQLEKLSGNPKTEDSRPPLVGFHEQSRMNAVSIDNVPEKGIDEIKEMANEMLYLANRYSLPESTWNGNVVFSAKGAGFNISTKNILTDKRMNHHMVLHEILHSKSVGHYNVRQYIDHLFEEELPVQFLTQEISRRHNLVEVIGGYEEAIDRLRALNREYKLFRNDYEFAVALYNTDLLEREDALKQLVVELAADRSMPEQELATALDRIEGAFHDVIL